MRLLHAYPCPFRVLLLFSLLSHVQLFVTLWSVRQFEHSLKTLPFFGIGMKTDLFQSCGHC